MTIILIFFKNCDQRQDFYNFLKIFENFDQNSDFSKNLTKIQIIDFYLKKID